MNNWRLSQGNLLTDLAIYLVLLLPLIMYPYMSAAFSLGRMILFVLFLGLLLLGAIFVGRFTATVKWWRSPIFWLVLIWYAVTVLSSLFGVNLYKSFWSTPTRATGLLFWGCLIAFILILLTIVRSKSDWLKLLAAMSWVGGLSAFYALLTRLLPAFSLFPAADPSRLSGLMGNPIFLGTLLLMTVFITLYFVLFTGGWPRYLYGISAFAQLVVIVLTASRGVVIGLLVGLLVLLAGYIWVSWRIKPRWRAGWLIVLGVGLAGGTAILLGGGALTRLLNFTISSDSWRSRLIIWQVAWQAFKDRPWWGYGLENFKSAFNHFYGGGLANLGFDETLVDRAHNLVLDQLVTGGVIGLAVLIVLGTILFSLLIKQVKRALHERDYRNLVLFIILIATITAHFATSLTAFDIGVTAIYMAVLVAAIIFFTAPIQSTPLAAGWLRVIPIVLLPLVLFIGWKYLKPAFQSAQWAAIGQFASLADKFDQSEHGFDQAQMYPNPYLYWLIQGYPTSTRKFAIGLMSTNQRLGDAQAVLIDGIGVLNRLRKVDPDNVQVFSEYPLIYAALSFFNGGYFQRATAAFDELVAFNPNQEYIYLYWGRTLMGLRKFDEAKNVLDRASKAATPPIELPFWRAIWGLQSNKSTPATVQQELQSVTDKKINFMGGDEPILSEVVDYLRKLKNWQLALYYQGELTRLLPKDAQQHLNLADNYQLVGKLDEAANEAKIAAQLDPSQAPAVVDFLKRIGRD